MATRVDDAVNAVQTMIDYNFTDSFLLWEALQAAGSTVVTAGGRIFPNGNKRLAVLGDTILQLAICEDWYNSGLPRGAFDVHRQRIGSNQNLNSVGLQAGLHNHVNRAGGSTAVAPATMATTVQAVLGAVYLDSDLQSVKSVMQTLGLV
ncbi:MAG: hypothetical protein Q9222_006589 [Ikaeria aurantiellina]